jgi:uncharacterized protein
MPYRRNATLDPSQVEDRRGRGPMLGLPGGGLTVGGGGVGIVGLVIYLLVSTAGYRTGKPAACNTFDGRL